MECLLQTNPIGSPGAGLSLSMSKSSVPLSSRLQFSQQEGLYGVAGAQKVIPLLHSYRNGVVKMNLNHNSLGDDGIYQLFAYLSSSEGSKHRATLAEISLTGNGIGCKGLQTIAEYLRGNDVLRALWLANNDFTPDPATLSCLANALNSSRLRLLSLTNNSRLGDSFVERFLPLLRSRSLQELHINIIGLTPRSAPAIASWITGSSTGSSQGVCHLQTLKCSGNSLGVKGVSKILRAIERGNWAITKVELYANRLPDTPLLLPPTSSLPAFTPSSSRSPSPAGSRVAPDTDDAWKDCERALHRIMMRNQYWKRRVEKEALNLLKYARPLLMRSKSSLDSAPLLPLHSSSSPTSTPTEGFPFFALPNELKLYILSLFAPSLSPTQRVHIYNYASDPVTLPPLVPTLRRGFTKQCLVDPSSLGATVGGSNYGSGCPAGKCMGSNSLVCRREEERAKFLEAVGCTAYEPELNDPVD
ncbi:hypothetical protein BKA83DRAFT_4223653 [Pisolithus microcarpus]|nr:hypothetical protein BKA83DRAFT_4223653 [Pisolithus microcarpus]